MKILMAVLVLALAFSGFSAASHAMSDTGHIVSSDTQDGSSDINSADSSKDDSKAEKVACPDCLHCCSHVVFQTDNKTRRNQATEIRLCLEVALNPKRRKKIDRAIKKLNAKRKPRKKKPPQNLSARDFIQPTFQSNPNLNTTDDVENYQPALQTVCFESKDTEQSTASSTEVTVDNTGEPLLEYQTIPNA